MHITTMVEGMWCYGGTKQEESPGVEGSHRHTRGYSPSLDLAVIDYEQSRRQNCNNVSVSPYELGFFEREGGTMKRSNHDSMARPNS